MTNIRHHGGLIIFITFVAALLFAIAPLPQRARPFRPSVYTLVLIYWCMAIPQRIGVSIAWITGITADVMTDTLLGQHALGLAIVAFIALKLHQRVRLFLDVQGQVNHLKNSFKADHGSSELNRRIREP